MAPKASKGKGVTKAAEGREVSENELMKLRKKHALFVSSIDELTLRDHFRYLWGGRRRGIPPRWSPPLPSLVLKLIPSSLTIFPAAFAPFL